MDATLIEIPEKLKFLAGPIRHLVAGAEQAMQQAGDGRSCDYDLLEAQIADDVAAVERATHQTILGSLDVDAPAVRIGGKRFLRVGHGPGDYHCMAGSVSVPRTLYREQGVRNGPTVDPVSLRAGVLGDGWLPRTAQAMAHDIQQGTSREAAEGNRVKCRLPYSRCSFERVGHLVGQQYQAVRVEVEDALAEFMLLPAEAVAVSASIDRVSLPMEEPRPRPVGRPRQGAPKRPVQRVYRMAYCATVTLHDAQARSLHTIRYGWMPPADTETLADALACDVAAMLRKRPDLHVVLLADGAPEMWNLLEAHLGAEALGLAPEQVHSSLDLWHVLEKLGKAARTIWGAEGGGEVTTSWHRRLLRRDSAPESILAELRMSGLEYLKVGDDCPVHEAITYLVNNADRMRYKRAAALGLPVGSGNVEATCKSLVQQRMKRAGARWKHDSGERVLQLRALSLSDRWTEAMRLTLTPMAMSVLAEKVAA